MISKKLLLAALLVMTLIFSSCGAQPAQEAPNMDSNQVHNQEAGYKVIKERSENKAGNTKIFYPQIRDYKGELLMEYMNQSLRRIVDVYEQNDMYKDVSIDYEITKMDESIISVLFKGKGKTSGGKKINIMQSVNLDIKSSNGIGFENLVKSDQTAKDEVRRILNQKAIAAGMKHGLEAEGIRIYFREQSVVFYYMPLDDSATEFIELSVPLNELDNLLNTEFGEKPAS